MNQIEVTINEFGPIKDQVIRIAPFMIFTGNSYLGKSYVNYLMYYFFSSFTEEGRLQSFLENKIKKDKSIKEAQDFTVTIAEIRQWLNENAESFMRNFLGDNSLKCDVNFCFTTAEEKLHVSYIPQEIPENIATALSNLGKIQSVILSNIKINHKETYLAAIVGGIEDLSNEITRSVQRYIQKRLFNKTIEKSLILPPARGGYVGENFSTKNELAQTAGMYRLFLRDFDKAVLSNAIFGEETDIQFFQSQIQKLINGKLVSEKGTQYLELPTGHRVPLTASAASIKELSPLLFYLMNWSNYTTAFCIEEPEAHLHPHMQTDVANLLAAILNKGSLIQLTTHSDYFLQRINQLIKLGYIRKQHFAQFEEICNERKLSKRFYLDKDQIAAYYFELDETTNQTKIIELEIDEKEGIPFSTFFDTIQDLSERDYYLNSIINQNEAYGNHEE